MGEIIDPADLKKGDRVTVTRSVEGSRPVSWTGVITSVGPNGGFEFDGHDGAGNPHASACSPADVLLRMYRCVQTITRA